MKELELTLTALDLLDLIFQNYQSRNLFNLLNRIEALKLDPEILGMLQADGAIEIEIQGVGDHDTHLKRKKFRKQKAILPDGSEGWEYKILDHGTN